MFCSNCGVKVQDHLNFCPQCGAKLVTGAVNTEAEELLQTTEEHLSGEVADIVDIHSSEDTEDNCTSENTQEEKLFPVESKEQEMVPAEQVKYCPECGQKNGIHDRFCQECGFSFAGETVERKFQEDAGDAGYDGNKKGLSKKGIGIAVGVAAVVIVGAVQLLSGGKTKQIVYLKDNEINSASGKKMEARVISDHFFDDEDDAGIGGGSLIPVQYTDNGKYVFYMKHYDSGLGDLYCKEAASKKDTEDKLDSDVISYTVADNKTIVYLKDDSDRKLYISNRTDKEKIASDVQSYWISGDKKNVMWSEFDGEETKLYVQDLAMKNGPLKIDAYTSLIDYAKDFSTIVYLKEDALYVCSDLAESNKIASDVDEYSIQVSNIDKDPVIYYEKYEDGDSVNFYDLVEDDMLAKDEKMEEPDIDDYTVMKRTTDWWGNVTKQAVTDESYYEALELYEQKEQREDIRQEMKEYEYGLRNMDIYYYHKGESTKLASVIGSVEAEAADGIFYVKTDMESVEKVKFSSIVDDYYEDYDRSKVDQAIRNAGQLYYLEGDKGAGTLVGNFDCADVTDIYAIENRAEKTIYLERVTGSYDEDSGDYKSSRELYSFSADSDGGNCSLITDVYSGFAGRSSDGIYYYRDEKDGEASLYLNDTKIDDDVSTSSRVVSVDGGVLYMKDLNADEDEGDLYYYKKGKTFRIDDSVTDGTYFEPYSGTIVYLTDYNYSKEHGDLCAFDGKEVINVDTDVTCVFYDVK